MSRSRNVKIAFLSLVCAALALCVATTSSSLYATNFWTDTNIYFTIGRGMTQGLMPYRDLFDHKGPLLYMIYALAALISDTSFIGVFCLEVISLAAMLFAGYKTVRLYGEGRLAVLSIPLVAMVTVTCTAFTQGGSAEEFCLPALSVALYAALRRMHTEDAHPARLHGLFGAAMGWVFLIKYTDCGLFFGLGAALIAWELWNGGLGRAAKAVFAMFGGFCAMVLPVAAYLWANGALGACLDVYFVQNLFTYVGEPMTLVEHLYNALAYLRTQGLINPAVTALAVVGMVSCAGAALLRKRRGCLLEALSVTLGAGLLLLFVYWGEMAHPYYALVFASLCPVGLTPLAMVKLPRNRCTRWASVAACGALVVSIVPVCKALCAAVPLMDVKKEEMPQTVFAAIMNEEESPTLLDLTSLDQGFYLAAGIMPSCRYFADNNLQTEEKKQAIAGYMADGATQFIVTRYYEPGSRYALVAQAQGVFDLCDLRTYKLYKRVDDGGEKP